MSGEIIETRRFKILGRRVTLHNVLTVAKILERQRATDSSDKYAETSFSARCTDDSAFRSQSSALFEASSTLSKKAVERIELEYRNSAKTRISVDLAHGNSSSQNEILISGTDGIWVNGMLNELSETFESFSPQSNFIRRFRGPIMTVLAIGTGAAISWMLAHIIELVYTFPSGPPPAWAVNVSAILEHIPLGFYLLNYAFYWMTGLIPADLLYAKLEALWPSVELQIGPEHKQIERSRRKTIAAVFVIGVAPLVVAAAYDVLKAFSRG